MELGLLDESSSITPAWGAISLGHLFSDRCEVALEDKANLPLEKPTFVVGIATWTMWFS